MIIHHSGAFKYNAAKPFLANKGGSGQTFKPTTVFLGCKFQNCNPYPRMRMTWKVCKLQVSDLLDRKKPRRRWNLHPRSATSAPTYIPFTGTPWIRTSWHQPLGAGHKSYKIYGYGIITAVLWMIGVAIGKGYIHHFQKQTPWSCAKP